MSNHLIVLCIQCVTCMSNLIQCSDHVTPSPGRDDREFDQNLINEDMGSGDTRYNYGVDAEGDGDDEEEDDDVKYEEEENNEQSNAMWDEEGNTTTVTLFFF